MITLKDLKRLDLSIEKKIEIVEWKNSLKKLVDLYYKKQQKWKTKFLNYNNKNE